jgi:hypothetical protein
MSVEIIYTCDRDGCDATVRVVDPADNLNWTMPPDGWQCIPFGGTFCPYCVAKFEEHFGRGGGG